MIRNAIVDDAERICELVKQRTVLRTGSELGFIEYPEHSVSWYGERIQQNKFYVVEIDRKVESFLSVYDDLRLDEFVGDQVVDWIKKNIESPFSYFDLLAVSKEFEHCHFGKSLLEYGIMRASKVVGAVAHSPKRNELPIRMIKKLGFELQEEITVYNGLMFGIYVKS